MNKLWLYCPVQYLPSLCFGLSLRSSELYNKVKRTSSINKAGEDRTKTQNSGHYRIQYIHSGVEYNCGADLNIGNVLLVNLYSKLMAI